MPLPRRNVPLNTVPEMQHSSLQSPHFNGSPLIDRRLMLARIIADWLKTGHKNEENISTGREIGRETGAELCRLRSNKRIRHYIRPSLENIFQYTLQSLDLLVNDNLKNPYTRGRDDWWPLCGSSYLFPVSSSGLLFLHVDGTGFPSITLLLSAEEEHCSSCDLELWSVTLT